MARELKEYGHNIEIIGFIIHQVNKDAGDRATNIKFAEQSILPTNKERHFVGHIYKTYNDKSGPTYGIFGDEDPTFKNLLSQYIEDHLFFDFSTKATSHYKKIITQSAPASGGFLMFIHFVNTDNNNEYLFVLTINNKDSYVVNEADLTIKDIKSLDLNRVDVACLIYLTKWDKIKRGDDLDSKTYLSFIKGKKDISYYFRSYIDCSDKTTNAESSRKLVRAIDEYCKEKGFDHRISMRKKDEIYQYCEECIKQKKEISLQEISSKLNNEDPSEFCRFAGGEKYEVSPIISGDKQTLRKIKFVLFDDNDFKILFDKNRLGIDIIYDRQRKQLTFKKLPDELVQELEQ